MSAYVVFMREKTLDPVEMALYSAQAGATLQGHDVKILAAYGPHEVLEGNDTEGMLIAEFPSMEAARKWYAGQEYRAVRIHRHRGAEYRAILVQGV